MNYKSYLVKKERIKNNYSIEDLAKIANTSKSHISRIENGRILSDDIANILLDKLRISFIDDNIIKNKLDEYYLAIVYCQSKHVETLFNDINSKENIIIHSNDGPYYYICCLIHAIVVENNLNNAKQLVEMLEDLKNNDVLDNYLLQIYLDYKGLYYQSIKDFDKAEKNLVSALNISNNSITKAMIYYHLTSCYYDQNNFIDAISANEEASKLFTKDLNSERSIFTQLHKANIFSRMKCYKKAISLYENKLSLYQKNKHIQPIIVQKIRSRIGWNYIQIKEYDKALKIINENTCEDIVLDEDYFNMCYLLYKMDDLDKMKAFIAKIPDSINDSCKNRIAAFALINNLDEAIDYAIKMSNDDISKQDIEFYYCFIQEMAEKRKLYKLSLEYAKKLLLLQ